MGTRIIDCCLCLGAEGSVLPIKIAILQRGSPAPDDHHLRPLMMYSSPWRRMLASILVASDEATPGSVMAKHERISPSSNGLSQRSFCSGVPYRSSTSMLPVSGAEQLNTSGPITLRPMISHRGAYSRLLNPAPYSLSGKNKFHRPAARALGFNSSITRVGTQRLRSISSWKRFSLG